MEHAAGAGNFHGAGSYRCCRCVWVVLSGRARLSSRPAAHSDTDVPEAFCGWPSDHLPYTHPWSVLVHTSRADPVDRGTGHANHSDIDRGLWFVYGTPRMEVGRLRLGL